jgi:squalene synthase HpnD
MNLLESSPTSVAPARPFPPQGAPRTSSFRMAMRILPARQRAAMGAIHAFCRAVDDVADADAPAPARRAALEAWRADVDACYAGRSAPRLAALAPYIDVYGLAPSDFHALIDGMLMDAQDQPLCAPSAATLDLYCDRVASAVGRLSVRVFGLPEGDGALLAHHLGRALQLTNILRDIDEDAGLGRVYLARERLLAAGMAPPTIDAGAAAILADPALPGACLATAAQARRHYAAADVILARNPGPAGRAPRLMAATYLALLARLAARGWAGPRAPVRLEAMARVRLLLRHGFG